jgi:hypothetical protein
MIVILNAPKETERRYHFPNQDVIKIGRDGDINLPRAKLECALSQINGEIIFRSQTSPVQIHERYLEKNSSYSLLHTDWVELPGGIRLRVIPEGEISSSKPYINLITLDGSQGAPRLIEGLARYGNIIKHIQDRLPAKLPQRDQPNALYQLSELQYETEKQRYRQLYFPSSDHLRKAVIDGTARPDAAFLVLDYQSQEMREQLRLIFELGVRSLVLFLDGVAHLSDEQRDNSERAARVFLSEVGFRGDDAEVIRGDTNLPITEKENSQLLSTFDRCFTPKPTPETDGSFLLVGEPGAFASGYLRRGSMQAGEEVELIKRRSRKRVKITRLEDYNNNEEVGSAVAGQYIACRLEGVSSGELAEPYILTSPGRNKEYRSFLAGIYTFSSEENAESRERPQWKLRFERASEAPFEDRPLRETPGTFSWAAISPGELLLYDLPVYMRIVGPLGNSGIGVITTLF